MKILQVNCVYNKGSTGKIVTDVHTALKEKGVESVVCYGRGEKIYENDVVKTCGEYYAHANHFLTFLNGVMYGGCYFSTNKLISVIKREKPDVVHLHCINGYFVNIYRIVSWLKKNHIKTVLTLHAEFMYTGNCGHAFDCEKWKSGCGSCPRYKAETKSIFFDRTHASWQKMKKAFEGFEEDLVVTSVSPWLMGRAKESVILGDKKHTVVLNGLDTRMFHIMEADSLRKKHGFTDEKIIFHATPSFDLTPNHLKGGYYINEIAKLFADKNVKVIVAGPYPEGTQVADNVIMLGSVADQTLLAQYYAMADVTLLTSRRETFSMVAAESLACCTPVVGFCAGGPEQISFADYSTFVPQGDLEKLESAVAEMLVKPFDREEISAAAVKQYSKEKMTEGYYSVYCDLIEKA